MTACLGKPERPSGSNPGEDGGGPGGADAGYIPNSGFLLRRQVAVGNLDGDSYDDAVFWGNAGAGVDEQGQRPVIRIYWGDFNGLTAEPDIDMRFDADRPWYEVLDVQVELADSLVFLTAEDLAERDSPPPHVRRIRSGFITAAGKYLEEPVFRSQDDLVVSGYVDQPAPAFIESREKTYGEETRLVFGFSDFEGLWMPTLGDEERLEPAESTAFLWDEDAPVIQEAFTVDDGADTEDMVVVTRAGVGRTAGDASAGQSIVQRPLDADCTRVVRARAEYGTFYGVATCEGAPGATLVTALNAGMAPEFYPVELSGASSPTDIDIIDVSGDPLSPEIIALEEGALVVYGDLSIGPPVSFAWDVSTAVDGFDLLAIGRFYGNPGARQIYLFSSTDPARTPKCFEVNQIFRLLECE